MLRFLWLRSWPLRAIVWTSLCAAILFVLFIAWPDNPLERWNREAAMWMWIVSGVVAVALPLRWLLDKAWEWVEAREERMAGEP